MRKYLAIGFFTKTLFIVETESIIIETQEWKEKYVTILDEIDINSEFNNRYYYHFFMLRRIFYAMILVILNEFPLIQLSLMQILLNIPAFFKYYKQYQKR